MSKILTLLFFLAANLTFSQNYMEGKRLYCNSENPEAMKKFDGAIEILYLNKTLEFIKFGTEKSITLPRKKYNEIKQYFPENPEGYYGLALTSAMLEDTKSDLENLDISVQKYKSVILK